MKLTSVQTYSFLGLLGLALILIFYMLQPFFSIIAFAAILAIIFWPLRTFFYKWTNSDVWGAGISFGIVFLFLFFSLSALSTLIIRELTNVISGINGDVSIPSSITSHLPESLNYKLSSFVGGLDQIFNRFATTTFTFLQSILSNAASFVFNLILLLFSLYYFLRDGDKILRSIAELTPLSSSTEERLFGKIITSVNGVVKGTFLIGLVQGIFGTVGFMLFGVPNPLLLGILMVFLSFIPTFGVAMLMVPSVVYLLLQGDIIAAVCMAIWGSLGVLLIDNFVSPRLLSTKTNIHPVLILFSVLGGIQFFGVLGILLGPISMAIFLALLDIYRSDVRIV